MKTIIYYFTGTGNSLAAAKKIAAALGDCELVPLASLQNTQGEIAPAADRVGIVCPVYDSGVPVIVAEFAGRLDLSGAGYVFAIVTLGGIGASALHQLNGIFREKQGRCLDAAFTVKMPGNFPPVGKVRKAEPGAPVLTAADARLADIAGIIDKGLLIPPGFSPLSSLLQWVTYGSFSRSVRGSDKAFSVSDACTSCGTCVNVCPVKNIMMVNDRPSWLHHCECCCACLHFCPVEAIDLNVMQGTKGRGRYRHPDLRITDMKAQRGE
jgi:ferredoxin/flavodoxin